MRETIKYTWNAKVTGIYKTNITNFKNNIEETIHQAEVKCILLGDGIRNIVNVISEALEKICQKNEIKKQTKTTTAQTMVWRVLWKI